MEPRHVQATQFKAKCLEIMDRVAETGEPVIITKRGKPIARLIPEKLRGQSLIGRHKGLFQSHGDLTEPAFPAEDWTWE